MPRILHNLKTPSRSRDSLDAVLLRWAGVALGALLTCVWLLAPPASAERSGLELRLSGEVRNATAERASSAGERPFQRLRSAEGQLTAQYGFVNFNDDALQVELAIPAAELASYREHYGYTAQELRDLLDWQKQGLAAAYQTAVEKELDQAAYDRLANDVKAEYRRKHRALLLERGFKFVASNTVAADIPQLVRRNVREVHAVAAALAQAGSPLQYSSEELLGACLAMVQTAFFYVEVPGEDAGRVTGGVTPPLELLASGRGDCDSKSALLAALLLNWNATRLVGVGVPNHYLLGVLRNPAKGEAFVEYAGLRYVLMEPAGPGWLPFGTIAPTTMELLNAGNDVGIEPLTAN